MRDRGLSSALVVVAGLVPTLIGGPIFALFMVALGTMGFREYIALVDRAEGRDITTGTSWGFIVMAMMAAAGLVDASNTALFAIVAIAVGAPILSLLPKVSSPGAFATSSLLSTGSLYLGLPVYAAVALRSTTGPDIAEWLSRLADTWSLGWESAPRGLAWALTAIMATWVGDSSAYFVGRWLGRVPFAPKISPAKTLEGAIGGLFGSTIVGGAAFLGFGLGPWWIGVIAGCIVGIAGQAGDLCESFLKRQAGVKDSGAILPGHGGILDRIDALVFAFPVSFVLAAMIDRLGSQ